ncbi:hypothetical protein NLM27_25795 [Bradyrhizobium sp. CCGB12]|uniref:hypothetical protein n=1 Tax=Bradyrhizobium sp. CCGB12 TaxID=2949632 RepID=UPI0020B27E0B|nr:hypothetical protein [Bradyrhizobium sp. CCGB12]MCP3392198.1 hypothetical protein [Bradyrhizobium sp. CCGB12]
MSIATSAVAFLPGDTFQDASDKSKSARQIPRIVKKADFVHQTSLISGNPAIDIE